jgi:hypothetical protein
MSDPYSTPITPGNAGRNPSDINALDRSLRRSHRTVLFVVAACAAVSALQAGAGEEAPPDPTYTTIAVVLALALIVARRTATSRVIAPKTSLALTLAAYAFASALAMLGTFVAITQHAMQTGLVYALAAAIFCLRPPQPMGSLQRESGQPPAQP